MPKFTLIGEHVNVYGQPDGTKVTYECEVEHINDLLEHVNLFIRGCGYSPDGTLDYYLDEEEMWANAHYEHDRFPIDHEERCGK